MITTKRIIICKTCKGEGKTIERHFAGHSRGWENKECICPDCNGSGRKKRIVTIEEIAYKPEK